MIYPLGIQTFEKVVNDNAVYIDKTALIHDLINQASVYFLSRPRRFGKSLLLSTLESLFLGKRSLFEGLAINETDYDFTQHPVIKLELAKDEFATADNLRQVIDKSISRIAQQHKVELAKGSYNQRFEELVIKLHQKTGQRVVLLIDEYDKPILNNLHKPVLPEIKQVLNAFYSAAKSLDEHWRFVFITGVSKFAKVSVFSGMNNLTDISMDKRYATICGVTQQELELNFDEPINELAKLESVERSEMLAKIKHWYNGYRFEENAPTVYNPYSLLCLFSKQKFTNYWFTTATPTFLIELIKTQQFNLADLNEFEVDELFFAATEPEQMSAEPVLLQTGYLTITDFDEGWYKLDFPNYEVRHAFNRAIVLDYGHTPVGDLRYVKTLIKTLNDNDIAGFIKTLKIFFANIPFDITLKQEKYFQSLFYALFTLLDFQVEAEVRTNDGRIDCVIQTDTHIYVIEFKLHDSKEDALQQIIDKQYAQKYQMSDKQIVLLGVEFDQDSRNIGGYLEKYL